MGRTQSDLTAQQADLTAQQVELLEARLHTEALRASAAAQLPSELARVREALERHAARQHVDLEPLWLGVERGIGRAGQRGELRRLVCETLSEQARPIAIAAASGALLFAGLSQGGPDVDDAPGGGGGADAPVFAAQLAPPDLDDDPPLDGAAAPVRPPLAGELDEVLDSWPDFAGALAAQLAAPQAEPAQAPPLTQATAAPPLAQAPAAPPVGGKSIRGS